MLITPNPYNPDATPWNEADGIPWSESSTRDLITGLEQGDSIEDIAHYLQIRKILCGQRCRSSV
jgi:hypothetical protein